MEDRDIAALTWGLPDGWVGWAPGDVMTDVVDVGVLANDPAATDAVLAAARAYNAIVSETYPGATFAAIWAPVPGSRRPLASAVLRTVAAPSTGRMSVEALLDLVRNEVNAPRGVRILDVAAAPSKVAAGDAVLRVLDKSPRFRRQVTREWTWYILPPGTDRTIACQLESSSVAHFDELANMATDIAHGVEVTLESA